MKLLVICSNMDGHLIEALSYGQHYIDLAPLTKPFDQVKARDYDLIFRAELILVNLRDYNRYKGTDSSPVDTGCVEDLIHGKHKT